VVLVVSAAAVLAAAGVVTVVWLGRDGGEEARSVGTVPSVVGLAQSAAEERLLDQGFSTQIVRRPADERPGTVVAQQPRAGRRLDGGVVVLVVSGGAEGGGTGTEATDETAVVVPNVAGTHHILAGAAVEARGLIADSVAARNDAECGTVLRQEPVGGARLRAGEHVSLTVSLGPDPLPEAQVPGLTGLAAAARTAAREFGFTVRTVEQRAGAAKVGVVLRQEPRALASTPELSQITIYVGS
jgi:beta-lactam-binding protein with PASTA domain